ncbi:TraB/GumN family protein [uncultured Aureimonas sp.]|uniref:TraB/GumN family protein n=1 Tax=uncultured Aureimonas sp. TaxID=1604662 RepID=UPI0025F15E93|nr:TraB/GumN family protein [uncultured Aureimonas sp.]
MTKRPPRGLLPAILSALPHLFPLLLCIALLLAAAVSEADAAEPAPAAPACREGRSLVPDLVASGEMAGPEREAAAIANGEGRLFRIEREGLKPSFLFGTMHLSDPRIVDLPDAADRALDGADGVVIETTDVLDPARMGATLLSRADLTTLPAGQTLAGVVGEEGMARIVPVLEARGTPAAAIARLQPWFVAAGLLMTDCETQRTAQGAKVLDVAIAERAAAAAKPLDGLETAAEQLEALASMPLDLQADNLVASVVLVDRMPDLFETMIDLYLKGQIALIGPATEKALPSGTDAATSLAVTQAFEDRVVHRRNALMAERLQPFLAKGGRFVAVGALHLPGETGLVAALRRAGWTVTRAD